jgi:autotransporter-associated beta strand protein
LSVHTLQVDSTRTFTLGGGTLTFNRINLMPDGTTPAKIAVTGDVNIAPLSNATATIANGIGGGNSGLVDLGGGNRTINVGNGTQPVDLSVNVPITNGGLIKNGSGTLSLTGASTYDGGTTVNDGKLVIAGASAKLGAGNVNVQGSIIGTALEIQSGANNAIADDATLSLFGGNVAGVSDAGYALLGTGINETVGTLILAGVAQLNGRTYGGSSSGALIQNDEFFAGSGLVTVGLLGDFNADSNVDVSDYVVWRSGGGTQAEYNVWRANFGQTIGSGAAAAVPEPAVLVMLLPIGATLLARGVRRGRTSSACQNRQFVVHRRIDEVPLRGELTAGA